MTSASSRPNNVGFQVWNMSKRISEVSYASKRSHQLVEDQDATRHWSKSDVAELERIDEELARCGVEVDLLWERLSQAANAGAPGVVEPPIDGVNVVKNREADPETMDRIWKLWRDGSSCLERGRQLRDELDALVENARSGEGVLDR